MTHGKNLRRTTCICSCGVILGALWEDFILLAVERTTFFKVVGATDLGILRHHASGVGCLCKIGS